MRKNIDVDKPWHKSIPFAQGVVVEGRLLITSGVTARGPDGNVIGAGNIRTQMEQCFANLGDVLEAAGCGFGDVVKYVMYTTDIEAFSAHADVYRSHFVGRPASTLVEVSRLIDPEMTVEIECVVKLPDQEATNE
jgi:enamine deaminase RidA (YjgF/YER057c/UK114 family)